MKQKRIILVEDEQTLLNLIESKLKEEGYEVQTAIDGKEGLRLIQEEKPDLVLLDMMLPGLRGVDIIETLHKEKILPDLPIVIISNSGEPIEIERVMKFGIRDYLIKVNFNPDEVLEKVNHVLEFESKKRKAGEKVKKSKTKSVLLIEDDTILADTLEKKFLDGGYDLHKAPNAKLAKSILEEHNIDIILLDIVLPDMNGLTLLQELKADARFKDIPVVITSNLGQGEEIQEGLKAGAVDYIVKTDTVPGEILEKVETLLKKGRDKKN